MLTYTNKTGMEERITLTDLDMHEMTVRGLKSGSKYNFCLKFMADSDGSQPEVAGLCKVINNMTKLNLSFFPFRAVHQVSSTTMTCAVEWISTSKSHYPFLNSPALLANRLRWYQNYKRRPLLNFSSCSPAWRGRRGQWWLALDRTDCGRKNWQ